MKRVLPSTIRRPHRLPPPGPIVPSSFRHARRSPFIPRDSPRRCSRRSRERREKEFSLSERRRVLAGRSSLSDITFILFRASSLPRTTLFPRSCVLSSSSRFVSSRLYHSRGYVIRIGPDLHGTADIRRRGLLTYEVQSPGYGAPRAVFPLCHQRQR